MICDLNAIQSPRLINLRPKEGLQNLREPFAKRFCKITPPPPSKKNIWLRKMVIFKIITCHWRGSNWTRQNHTPGHPCLITRFAEPRNGIFCPNTPVFWSEKLRIWHLGQYLAPWLRYLGSTSPNIDHTICSDQHLFRNIWFILSMCFSSIFLVKFCQIVALLVNIWLQDSIIWSQGSNILARPCQIWHIWSGLTKIFPKIYHL